MAENQAQPVPYLINIPGVLQTETQAVSNAQAIAQSLYAAFQTRNEFWFEGKRYEGEVGLKSLIAAILNHPMLGEMAQQLPGSTTAPVEIPLPLAQTPPTPQPGAAPAQAAPSPVPSMASRDEAIDAIVRKASLQGLPREGVRGVVEASAKTLGLSGEEQDDLSQALLYAQASFLRLGGRSLNANPVERLKSVTSRYQWKRAFKKAGFHKPSPAETPAPRRTQASPSFDRWIDTFLAEKGLDLEDTFEFDLGGEFHMMPYAVVVEAMKSAPEHEQRGIKDMLVKIDFRNGDVSDYLRHLGKGLAANRAGDIGSEAASEPPHDPNTCEDYQCPLCAEIDPHMTEHGIGPKPEKESEGAGSPVCKCGHDEGEHETRYDKFYPEAGPIGVECRECGCVEFEGGKLTGEAGSVHIAKILVLGFFGGDERKALLWWGSKNPSLGNISPIFMVKAGKANRLLKWIENQLGENKPTLSVKGDAQQAAMVAELAKARFGKPLDQLTWEEYREIQKALAEPQTTMAALDDADGAAASEYKQCPCGRDMVEVIHNGTRSWDCPGCERKA